MITWLRHLFHVRPHWTTCRICVMKRCMEIMEHSYPDDDGWRPV